MYIEFVFNPDTQSLQDKGYSIQNLHNKSHLPIKNPRKGGKLNWTQKLHNLELARERTEVEVDHRSRSLNFGDNATIINGRTMGYSVT
jgi:hypothetical protein